MHNSLYDPITGCWNWIGKISKKGYGVVVVRIKGRGPRNKMAHRIAYEELTGGKIPLEMTLDHNCLNKRCINPMHQSVVTRVENVKRQHRRYKNGED